MMRGRSLIAAALCAMAAGFVAIQSLPGQGKGKGAGNSPGHEQENPGRGRGRAQEGQARGRGHGQDNQGPGRGSGRMGVPRPETSADQRIERRIEREFAGDVSRSAPDRADRRGKGHGRFARPVVLADVTPALRRFIQTGHAPARAAVGAVSRAHLRGVGQDALEIDPAEDHVRILNGNGIVLIDLDDERARNLGRWDVVPLDDDVSEGAPAFCRTGEGHPVFGRQWCIDKRFGLGGDGDFRWGHTERITDLVFLRPVRTGTLTRDALLDVLGAVAFDRLALHAITLGLTAPLTARWMVPQEPGAARVLLVSSGVRPVAEVVDVDRDDRADMLVVALRGW